MSLLLLLCPPALAGAVEPLDRFVASSTMAVGLAADASLVNGLLDLGLLADPDGPEGPEPAGGDWLSPGNQFEAWSATLTLDGVDRTLVNGAPYTDSTLDFEWTLLGDVYGYEGLHGFAEDAAGTWEAWVDLPEGDVLYLSLVFTPNGALDAVAFARTFDPDPDAWLSGSYDAVFEAGQGYVVAGAEASDRALALALDGGAGALCEWCTDAATLASGPTSGDGDWQGGVWIGVEAPPAGQPIELVWVYAIGPDVDTAVARATAAAAAPDRDGDGAPGSADCDDRDPSRAPTLAELADGVDNDCDEEIDDGLATGDGDPDWVPDVPADTSGEEGGGCGCASGGPGAGLTALLLGLGFVVGRRAGGRR